MGVFSKMVVVTNDTTKSDGFGVGVIDDIIMNNSLKLDMSSPISSPIINNNIDDSNENSIDNHSNFLKYHQIDEPRAMPHIRNSQMNDDDTSDEIMLHSARTNENTNYSDEIILVSSNSIDLDDNYYDSNVANDINDCKSKQFTNNVEKYSSEQNENFKEDTDLNTKDRQHKRQRIRKNFKSNSNFKQKNKLSMQPTISNQLFAQTQSEIAKRLNKSNLQKNYNKKKFHIFKNLSNGKNQIYY